MTRSRTARVAFAAALVIVALVGLVAAFRLFAPRLEPGGPRPAAPPVAADPTTTARSDSPQGWIFGRIRGVDGSTYEGRLRWGGAEEAFWSDFFNGVKVENPWSAVVPPDRLPKESRPVEIFGLRLAERQQPIPLQRPFMARFGDLVRIEARGRSVHVTLKSGTAFELDRFEASDFDDGVRVWDARRGVVDLDSLQIAAIELLPTPPLDGVPGRLHGTVRTAHGDYAGFVQWNRQQGVASDELEGRFAEGRLALRFDALRSIARRSPESSLVTLRDGRELVLSGSPAAGDGHRGVYVDDPRYGRVLVPWDAFERLDFDGGAAGTGPAYDDFPPGHPLRGGVTLRDGRTLSGRLVYDLDESETTETLDARSRGVDYILPFGRIASITPREGDAGGARVVLHDGEELELEGTADVDRRHGGMLIYPEGGGEPGYVRWEETVRIDFDRPPPDGFSER